MRIIVIKKGEKYYLGILNAKDKPDFGKKKTSAKEDSYQKMVSVINVIKYQKLKHHLVNVKMKKVLNYI